MKIINRFIPFILLFVFAGCTTVEGQTSKVRTFKGIDGIVLMGSGYVDISIGNKEEITLHAPADLIPYLLTEKKDGTLYIGKRKKGWKKFRSFYENIHYDLVVKQINRISVSGSGNIEIDQINSEKLKVTVSGSGDIDIDNLSADILRVSINGSGNINLDGKVDELDVTISGSGDFTGNNLKAEDVSIDLYGSGDVCVWATKSLDVHVSGSGDVTYHGNPTVNSRVTGSGDIRRR